MSHYKWAVVQDSLTLGVGLNTARALMRGESEILNVSGLEQIVTTPSPAPWLQAHGDTDTVKYEEQLQHYNGQSWSQTLNSSEHNKHTKLLIAMTSLKQIITVHKLRADFETDFVSNRLVVTYSILTEFGVIMTQ